MQKAPIAIDTVSAAQLAAAGVTDPAGLTQLVPSVQFGKAAGPYYVFFLRGVGSNATSSVTDSAVSLSLGGVPLARQYNLDGQFFDLERVEVLEGPQGTLLGRNATGGSINLIPKRPDSIYSADFGVSTGNYNLLQTSGDVNVPITDKVAARVSFQTVSHSGYLSDGEADDDTKSGRIQLKLDPVDSLSILLTADTVYQGGKGGGNAIGDSGFNFDQRIGLADPRVQAVEAARGLEVVNPNELFQNNHYYGLKGQLDWKTDLGTLTITPAYRHASLNFNALFGGVERDIETDNQETIEARFASNDRGFLRWIVGAFYLNDSVDANFSIDNLNKTGNQQIYNTSTKSGAVYADGTVHINDRFRLFAGIRYTDETKGLDGTLHNPFLANPKYIGVDETTTNGKVTYRAGAQFDVTNSSMVYGSISTGFRSGGFFFTVDDPVFKPETITAYTIGSKNRFFDNHLQLNIEAFDWEYKNQQLAYTARDSAGDVVFATANAGATSIRGAELDVKYQLDQHTQIGIDVQYLNSTFNQFTYLAVQAALPGSLCSSTAVTGKGFNINCQGLTPPESPTWTVNPFVEHNIDLPNGGSLSGNISAHYQTQSYTALNLVPSDLQNAYITGNGSLTYTEPHQNWTVSLFADNLGNVAIKQFTTHTNFAASQLLAPLTFGVRAALHFQ